jgi:hypothetical protein
MNHDPFKKWIGQSLRLEPRTIGPDDRPVDDDWTVADVDAGARRRYSKT